MSPRENVLELQERLFQFGLSVCRALRTLRREPINDHCARQLLKSATSPPAVYGEARAAESRADFIHKMQICLKELRESEIWLRYLSDLTTLDCAQLRAECNELTAIFVTSVKTARKKSR